MPLLSTAAPAASAVPGAALARLSDDTVAQLRESLTPTESTARQGLRQVLTRLREDMASAAPGVASKADGRPQALRPAGGETEASGLRGMRAGAHRAELRVLRQQVMEELATLRHQIQGLDQHQGSVALQQLIGQAERRFDRLDQSLARLEAAGQDDAAAAVAQRTLAALLNELTPRPTALAAVPVPTRRAREPRLPPLGDSAEKSAQSSTTLPRYALDMLRDAQSQARDLTRSQEQTQARYGTAAAGFGFVKVAATLPPVAAQAPADCGSTAADLADDGAEVQLSPEVRDLARNLDYSPTRMLVWMQREMRFEPYWGSLKGAVGALQSRSGNATDHASLLIALLRASNIPARYVRGNVSLVDQKPANNTQGRAQRWLGTKNYAASVAYLSAGIASGPFKINNTLQGVAFEHVWVQACLPYAAYRGTQADAAGMRWLALDGVVKDHDYQAGLAVNVPLDAAFYNTYLATLRDDLPTDYLAAKVEATARVARSDASIDDVPYRGSPRSPRFDVLPSAPPFRINNFTNWPGSTSPETAAITQPHRHQFSIEVRDSAGAVLASALQSFPQDVQSRLTVSYQPDAGSQSLWNNWGGTLAGLPTSVQVYPEIKRDGTVVGGGSGAPRLALGATHALVMKLTQGETTRGACINSNGDPRATPDPDTSCLNKTVYNNLRAGAYYALGVNANTSSNAQLEGQAQALSAGISGAPTAPTPASGAAYEATVGALLHLVLQTYIHDITAADQRIAELRGFKSTGFYDIGLTGSELQTEYLFDLPLVVKPAGVYVDFKGGQYGFTKIDTGANLLGTPEAWQSTLRTDQRDLAKLSIYAGSALEHHVWQQALRTDAVSTVRGLQYAQANGINLVTLNAGNIANFDALMQTSGATSMLGYKAQIQAEVAAGATVTVPRAQIAYADPTNPDVAWRGAVYMSENPTTGSYGAIIGGSLSGGYPLLSRTPVSSLYVVPSSTPSFAQLASAEPSVALQATAPGKQGSNSLAALAGDPVNMLTGNLVHHETDLRIGGRGGLPIVLERWYNSGTPRDGPLGFGWTHSFNHQLRLFGVEAGQAKLGWVNGSGGETYFATSAHSGGDISRGAVLANPPGTQVQFSRVSGGADDGRFRIRERDGLVYLFTSATGPAGTPSSTSAVLARLESITDRNGNRLTLNYNAGNQLANVSDSAGRTVLSFTWEGGRIRQVSDLAGRSVIYTYGDGRGNLTQVTDALGQAHGYSYFSATDGPALDHHMKRLTQPRGNGMAFEYYGGSQVLRHTPFDVDGSAIAASALSFHYNFFGRESWTVNERGHEQHFGFDKLGNTVRISQPGGGVYTYQYDTAKPHNRLSETDAVGRTTRYSYTADDLLDTVTLPSGATLQYRDYTAFAQPQRTKNARGHWTWLRYDAAGNALDSIQLRAGVEPVAGTLPGAADMRAWLHRSYDSAGNVLSTTRIKDFAAATGPSQTLNWSADRLRVLSLTRSGNRNGSTVTETSPSFSYDNLNRQTGGIDERWYPRSFEYDALDRLTSTSDALGNLHKSRFDTNGNPVLLEVLDATGNTRLDSSAKAFDGQDRPISTLDHAGNKTSLGYDEAGNLIAHTSPDDFSTGFEYDENNRAVAAIDAAGNTVRSQLDAIGRPLAATDANGYTTRYSYWGASTFDGRLQRRTLPAITGQSAGRAVELDYDEAGQVIRSREVAGDGSSTRQTYAFYDELGRTVRSLGLPGDDGQRLQTCQRFDTLGNLTEVWAGPSSDLTSNVCNFADSGLKRQAGFEWDDFGQLLARTDALGARWAFSWDAHGNLASSQTPEQARLNQRSSYTYDTQRPALLAQRVVPGAGSVSYLYNALGQVLHTDTTDDNGRLLVRYEYRWDVAHRLSSLRDSRGPATLLYEWTPGGRLATLSLAGPIGAISHRWDYRYDASGRLAAVLAPNGQASTLAYDPAGQLISRATAGGVLSTTTWHPDGSLQAISHSAPGNNGSTTVLASHSYGYDVWGRRKSLAESVGGASRSYTWGYDAMGRLSFVGNGTASQDERYGFDVFGNRSSRSLGTPATQGWTASHDDAHQLTQEQQTVGGTAVSLRAVHDRNGQLTRLCEGTDVSGDSTSCTGSLISSLQWDGSGQLLGFDKSVSGSPVLSERYTYDDQGQRLSKTSAGVRADFIQQGQALLAEWVSQSMANPPTAVYAHAGADEPVLRLTGASGTPEGAAQVYLADGLGSVRTAVGPPVNVALAANGGVATASSGTDPRTPVSAVNDGDRTGTGWQWGRICCWADSTPSDPWAWPPTPGAYPDWVQVKFAGSKTISRVDVFGVQDGAESSSIKPVEPTPELTWSTYYGLIDFEVQAWVGGQWVTVPGGHIEDNHLVWNRIDFAPITTDRIRVLVHHGATGYSRIVEIQAWATPTSSQTFTAWGQKTTSTGEAIARFGYTGREGDASGLNFHSARYYHPGLGRFISRDPLGLAAGINPYAYADGDPANFSDPGGLLAKAVSNEVSSYFGGTGSFAPTSASSNTLGSALKDTGRAAGNLAITAFEVSANLFSGAIPGGPDYVSLGRFQYDSPAFGATLEVAGAVGAATVLPQRSTAAASFADRVGGNATREVVVIGEGMADRVIPTASARGASWYNPVGVPPEQWFSNNKSWINTKMDQGCRILDCGAAPGRANHPNATSPSYKMELDQISKRNYPVEVINMKGK